MYSRIDNLYSLLPKHTQTLSLKTDKMTKIIENELAKLGLECDEAKVYVALLDLGDTTAGPVVKAARLHRQTVYDTIEKLKKKDLVTETIQANRKHWLAASPARILDTIKRKENIAEKLLPELLARQTVSDKKQEVRIYEGAEGFVAAQMDGYKDQPKSTEMYVLGATPKYWIEMMRGVRKMRKHDRLRIERKIAIRLIFSKTHKKEAEALVRKHITKTPEKHLRSYRYLSDEYHSPVMIQVWYRHITLVLFGEPTLTINIKNKDLADSFRVYFELLWKMSNE